MTREQVEELLRWAEHAGDFLAQLWETENLVRWLAAAWGPNDPAFPKVDPRTGQDLPENERLERTWYRVVRGSTPQPHSWGDLPEGATVVEHAFDPSTGETDRREASSPSLSSTDPGD